MTRLLDIKMKHLYVFDALQTEVCSEIHGVFSGSDPPEDSEFLQVVSCIISPRACLSALGEELLFCTGVKQECALFLETIDLFVSLRSFQACFV